jgi:predicted Zn-dependent peptidase
MAKFYFEKLKNNLDLLVIKTKNTALLDITLYVKVGSVYENKENNGISHLLEHLLFLKTKNNDIDSIALDIYPYTHKEFTYFEITTHRDLLDSGLSTLFSVVNLPDFSEKNLRTVKNIAKEELRDFYDNSYDVFNQEIDSFLYKNNSLSFNIGGSEENIEKIELKDIEEWYKNYYCPENMLLTLVGDIDVNKTVKHLNSILKSQNPGENYNKKRKNQIIYPDKKSKIIEIKNSIDFQQTHLAIVFPVVGINHYAFISFVLLAEILNRKIRQAFENSGLLYDVELSYQNYLNSGEFRIMTTCQKKNANKLFQELDSFIENFKISSSFFKEVKKHLKYQFLMKEDRVDEMSSLSLYLLDNKSEVITVEEEVRRLERTELDEIKKIQKEYFNKKNAYYFSMNQN